MEAWRHTHEHASVCLEEAETYIVMDADNLLFDTKQTIRNSRLIRDNKALSFWYKSAFDLISSSFGIKSSDVLLEIGSGGSSLKDFHSNLITSDILSLPSVDLVLDCQYIDCCEAIADQSLDGIIAINTLHHITEPLAFLRRAKAKLKTSGKIYLLEPYFSFLSSPIYQYLHSESANLNLQQPIINRRTGPLSSSEQSLPFLLFFRRPEWLHLISNTYDVRATRIKYYSSLSYFLTGGVTVNTRLPLSLFKFFHLVDQHFASRFPKICASFFIAELSLA